MSQPAIQRAAIVGSGMLGATIVHLSVTAGMSVVVKVRAAEGAVDRARAALQSSLGREAKAGRLAPAEAQAAPARARFTTDAADLAACDIVLEVIPELSDAKEAAFREIASVVSRQCVIASSTSAISIATLAACVSAPERVVGMHYFWPAYRRRLVEIAPHSGTSPAALHTAQALAGAQHIRHIVTRDLPGFLTTRIFAALLSEAIYAAGQGASFDEIDRAMVAYGWQIGPFRLLDTLSVDTMAKVYASLRALLGERGAGLDAATQLVAAGQLGRKSGAGFYRYDSDPPVPNPVALGLLPAQPRPAPAPEDLARRITAMLVHEAAHCLAEGVVAGWPDVDVGASEGLAFPPSLGCVSHYVCTLGWQNFIESLRGWEALYGSRFAATWLGRVPEPRA